MAPHACHMSCCPFSPLCKRWPHSCPELSIVHIFYPSQTCTVLHPRSHQTGTTMSQKAKVVEDPATPKVPETAPEVPWDELSHVPPSNSESSELGSSTSS